jgi:hypothetical protein
MCDADGRAEMQGLEDIDDLPTQAGLSEQLILQRFPLQELLRQQAILTLDILNIDLPNLHNLSSSIRFLPYWPRQIGREESRPFVGGIHVASLLRSNLNQDAGMWTQG